VAHTGQIRKAYRILIKEYHFGDLDTDGRMDLKRFQGYGMDLPQLRQCSVAGSCENSNEPSSFIKAGGIC